VLSVNIGFVADRSDTNLTSRRNTMTRPADHPTESRAPMPHVPSIGRWRKSCVAFTMTVAACVASPAGATLISFDTTTLAGTSARLDFSLLDGDFDLGNNNATIASITTDGSLGAADCSVGCSGGPPYTIDESLALGQYLQDLTLGSFLSFDLSFTTNFSGSNAPDRLSLLLLDPVTNFTLVDTNLDFPDDAVPVQDALLLVDLAPGARIQLASDTNPSVPGSIPEPGTIGLIGLGLALLSGHGIRRRRISA
jgi:hypothetical protein